MSDEQDAFDAVVRAVHDRVTPDAEERARLESVAAELTARAEAAVEDIGVDADIVRVGSTARGTWLAGDRDIDLFVRFPDDLSRERLEAYGLQVGSHVLPEGHEEYAEHPYVKGEYDGFDVDCVPCYDVDSAAEIQSAVDRTPFHNAYLAERLDDALAGEVRVAKAFLKAVGAYGSNLRTKGFSGYLVELLILEFGGFRELVESAADWNPPVRFDPEDHGTREYGDDLVVVDPTDPERNVAAACSATNVARLQHYSRALLAGPRESLFEPHDPAPLDAAGVREAVRERATEPVAVRFETPDVVEDQLYPQLDKSLAGLRDELARRGFDPLRSARFATDEHAVLLVECGVAERPHVQRHDGPPVGVRAHAEGFYGKYDDDPDVYGPYIEDGRYVVEREREFRTPVAFCESDALFGVALGPHVESSLERGYDVLAGETLGALAPEFGDELARYFAPVP
ncbi:CCA tRNA nucleotidyltransferase [Salinirubellus salinus]|uniref:CCA-adding enzyme n=1 Tax=Salinirubellus salinus TaxID=1364945 RepID=A0A9E7R3A1_9EURY|nr:CCA tRNA nucleotidyltransferase [Salinirubellus salinus]UWM53845.1 CCA tRNA nucleotidyltransferase [Salinirubellus salinus]